jgi:hypothetical protein
MHIETDSDAVDRRRTHRKILKRGTANQQRVARVLGKCRKECRCKTEACPVCLRDFRVWWTGEAAKIFVQRPHWTRCSIIADGLRVRYRKLSSFDLVAQIKRIRKRLERSALHRRIIFGALDVSLNIENNRIMGWQWHAYIVVEGQNDRTLQQAVKKAFVADSKALVPYDFEQIEHGDYLKVATYLYKSYFKRRSGYTDARSNHQTKNYGLKGADLRELLDFLAQHPIGARLILCGVRRNGDHLMFTRRKGSKAT